MRVKTIILFLLSNIFSPLSAYGAAEDEKNCTFYSEAGLRMESFYYRESGNNNQLIDKETGLLPGLHLGLSAKCRLWEFGISGGQQRARLEYNGQTNNGIKFLTRTLENINEVSVQVGRRFLLGDVSNIGVYGGAGYWQWQRNIASVGNVSGLDEKYRWRLYFLGSNVALLDNKPQQLLLDLRWLHMEHARLSVDFRGVFDRPEDLPLGTSNGWRVALPWRYNLNPANSMRIEPYAEAWHIAQTGAKKLFRDGVEVGNFLEPRSSTRLYGVTLNWQHSY
jgi:hypothetical protein